MSDGLEMVKQYYFAINLYTNSSRLLYNIHVMSKDTYEAM